jgi:hypothetical protein
MSSLDQQIADLEARLAIYETEYDAATTPETEYDALFGPSQYSQHPVKQFHPEWKTAQSAFCVNLRSSTLGYSEFCLFQSMISSPHCDLKSMIEDSRRMLTALFPFRVKLLY